MHKIWKKQITTSSRWKANAVEDDEQLSRKLWLVKQFFSESLRFLLLEKVNDQQCLSSVCLFCSSVIELFDRFNYQRNLTNFLFCVMNIPCCKMHPEKNDNNNALPYHKKNVLHAYIHVSSSVSSLRLVFTANKWYNLCSLRQLLPSSTSQGRRNREQSLFLSC